jgi:hypothetical protein
VVFGSTLTSWGMGLFGMWVTSCYQHEKRVLYDLPRGKLRVSKKLEFIPRSSPPKVFIGGPVRTSPGFPLKACGNDELGKAKILLNKLRGIQPILD